MKQPPFDSLDQITGQSAAGLAQFAAASAFHLFQGGKFRRLAGFEKLSQVEQDRIFNELVVASIVLTMLVLEAPDLRVPDDFRGYLTGLNKRIPKAYVDYLRDLGLGAEHLRDWEKLIGMRYEEYARDRHDVRAAAMQIRSEEKALDLDDLSKIQLAIPVETVAIGCHHHICRGSTGGRDELFKIILQSLSQFYVEFRGRIEGRKITPFTKARVALKRVIKGKRKGN